MGTYAPDRLIWMVSSNLRPANRQRSICWGLPSYPLQPGRAKSLSQCTRLLTYKTQIGPQWVLFLKFRGKVDLFTCSSWGPVVRFQVVAPASIVPRGQGYE